MEQDNIGLNKKNIKPSFIKLLDPLGNLENGETFFVAYILRMGVSFNVG